MRFTFSCRLAFLVLPLLVLSACQSSVNTLQTSSLGKINDDLRRCLAITEEFRRDVLAAKANDGSAPTLTALPMFHSNRFLSYLALEVSSDAQIEEWLEQSAALGNTIRHGENQNLQNPWTESRLAQIGSCATLLINASDLSDTRRKVLETIAPFEDHYSVLPQWLGFNWLLKPIFKWRIEQLHEDEKRLFQQANVFEQSLSYAAASANLRSPYGLDEWFRQAYQSSSLGLPKLTHTQLIRLFDLHAPTLTIEFEDDNDRLGQPSWAEETLTIDTDHATVYTLPSFTRFGDSTLLQLNYVMWFSERKPVNWIDLYAGKIDSLIWRVTLDEQGKVLLYDSIHSCGCYHKYFIGSETVSIREPALSREPANIFDLGMTNTRAGLHLLLSANEHYIVGVDSHLPDHNETYQMQPYTTLSALNHANGSKSLFSPSGIILASKRLERFTLWPTGIESVGAMRQWGTHAIGFVDQQQFDDATLLDHHFIRKNPEQSFQEQ